jgi:hypothetical protein
MKGTSQKADTKQLVKQVFPGKYPESISIPLDDMELIDKAKGDCSDDCTSNCGEAMTYWGSRDLFYDRNK